MRNITFKEVKTVAQGRWGSILTAIAGGPMQDAVERGSSRHSLCPIHGGTKPFRVFKDFEDTGGCVCSQCGTFNDGFAFLQEMYGWSGSEVLKEVAATLGIDSNHERPTKTLPPRKITPPIEISAKEIEDRQKKMMKIWWQGLTVEQSGSEPMMRYFYNRGLDMVETPLTLKMVLSHSYYEEMKFQANYSTILAQVSDPSGACIALHRTYLTYQGLKAPVECPKKLLTNGASLKGAAIRLFNPTETLGLCEGIETALAVNQMTQMPTWACISANVLKQVQVPHHIKSVVIWADKDRSLAGQKAALSLAERLYEEGFEVSIKLPELDIPSNKKSIDWLDVFNARQTHSNPLRKTA